MTQTAATALAASREKFTHVVQGEFMASADPGAAYTTILGSCVAACLHDPVARVGGMNHFLLPGDDNTQGGNLRYGVHAMELLINALLGMGARRERLTVKLFGGAHVVNNLVDIGARNAAFARRFVEEENVLCLGASLGGERARRIQFWPASGRARQIMLGVADTKPILVHQRIETPADGAGSLELF